MKSLHLIALFALITIFGCESLVTEVSPDNLPDIKSKLVVQSFISPQASQILVSVTESEPLFGESNTSLDPIKNAIVKISDGSSEVVIPYNSTVNLYSIDKEKFTIVAGKTYTLSVSDATRSVTATCKVPVKQAAVKSYEIDTVYNSTGFDRDSVMTVKMTWQDIPVDTNYYRVRAYLDLEYNVPEGNTAETFKIKRTRNRFTFRWDNTIGRNDYQSDANLDGAIFSSAIGRVTLPVSQTFDYGFGNKFVVNPDSKIIAITFDVENTDATYFKYHRSLELSGNENPFSEPTLIYNNINGGLGCFAAFNSGQLVFQPQ